MNKRNLLFTAFASLAVAAVLIVWSSRQAQGKAATETWSKASIAASDLLNINDDGTLSIKPDAMLKLSEDNSAEAKRSLEEVNQAVIAKKVAPFGVGDDRLQSTAEILRSGNGRIQPAAAGNCYCSRGCCSLGLCCQSGWWIFCWKLRAC